MATSAAESLRQTESLFAKNHEPFFNRIGQKRPFAIAKFPTHSAPDRYVSFANGFATSPAQSMKS
jgi:hypothetical protein